ncbi:MAG: hypothetical protein JHD33_04270 [Chthoniobacterales bacterium]|jgi:hypothetical protein|nr:hypothetical protein [Chthoniobacterales bacterium]
MNQDVHNLLRLKRYEMPSPDYFERFIDEFHHRQRADLISRPTLQIVFERIMNAFPDFHMPRLAYAGVAAAAVLFSAVILSQQPGAADAPASFALNSPAATRLPAAQSDIRLPVSMRPDFPPHYVLETRPVSYASPYSF